MEIYMSLSSSNISLWNPIIQIGILAAVLLAANMIQRKVPFINRLLLPTAVLGGFLALELKATGVVKVDTGFMENVTYHTIALGFIALGLRLPRKSETADAGRGGLKSGILIVSTYLVQGFAGLAITGALAYTVMPGLFKASGILLPMAYGQGPGQANNIGTTYEAAYGFTGGASFGLTLATMGFLWACVGGVIYLNILIKRKKYSLENTAQKEKNITVSEFQDEGEVPMSESVDRLTIQIALVLAVYLATYLLSLGMTAGISAIPGIAGSADTLNSLIWGFNFITGTLLALLLRNVLSVFKNRRIIRRQYQNNYLLNRIAGMIFDIMIVAGISAIDINDLTGLWVPFIILSTVGGFLTLFYLKWICKKVYPEYYMENFLAMYGMLTGTVSTGILLLREVDPNYTSPAMGHLVSGTSFGIIFGIPMLLFIGFAPQSDAMFFITLAAIVVYGGFLHWLLLRKKKTK
jgi:ESS family glutamate:Na+ symporter